MVDQRAISGRGDDNIAEHLSPAAERLVARHDQTCPFIPGRDQLKEQVRGLGFERDTRPHRSRAVRSGPA